MTTAFDKLVSGELVQALIDPFSRIIGETFFLFFLLLGFLIFLYFKTETITLPFILFLVIVGSVSLSSLFPGIEHPLIPGVFDVWIFMFLVGALVFIIWSAWFKK